MAKHNNVKDLCVDIANAIRAKKGTVDLINPQDFSAEIALINRGGKVWTGHADAEGLMGYEEEEAKRMEEEMNNLNNE